MAMATYCGFLLVGGVVRGLEHEQEHTVDSFNGIVGSLHPLSLSYCCLSTTEETVALPEYRTLAGGPHRRPPVIPSRTNGDPTGTWANVVMVVSK